MNSIAGHEGWQDPERILPLIPAGICLFERSLEARIIYAGSFFFELFGYTPKEAARAGFDSFLFPIEPDTRRFVVEQCAVVLAARRNYYELEYQAVHRTKGIITVLARGSYDKETNRIIASVIDVSDRKAAQEALRVSEEDYRVAASISGSYFWRYDIASRTCTYMFDSEKIFGVPQQLGDMPEAAIELGMFAEESAEEYRKLIERIHGGEKAGKATLRCRNLMTGNMSWYMVTYRTVFSDDGKPLHTVFTGNDITALREQETAYKILRQQVEARGESMISYYEVNLTTGICEYLYGAVARRIYDCVGTRNADDMVRYAAQTRLCDEESREMLLGHLLCERLALMFRHGSCTSSFAFPGLTDNGAPGWTRVSVNMAKNSYSDDIMAYILFEVLEHDAAAALQAEKEREKTRYYEDAYDKLSSSVMYGVCKYRMDDELTIIFANDIFYQLHGFASSEEAKRAGFTGVLYAIPAYGKKTVLDSHLSYVRENARGDKAIMFETEYPAVNSDGKEVWILCRGVYSPDESLFNASLLDITDRKRAEEQLRINEERYMQALRHSGRVFFFFDIPSRTMKLSDELAQAFGLPNEVDNMPDNFIARGLVEEKSTEAYRRFYKRIISGEPAGETIIACHMAGGPETVLWYKIAFSTVFDMQKRPYSAIITYEDLTEQRQKSMDSQWMITDMLATDAQKYTVREYNLSTATMIRQSGELLDAPKDGSMQLDDIRRGMLADEIHPDDVGPFSHFVNPARLLRMFEEGKTSDSTELRSLDRRGMPRWVSLDAQLIADEYSGDIFARIIYRDINEKKTGEIQTQEYIRKIQTELENSRIKVMVNQMQPHFLYNALSAIRTITKKNPDYAYDLLYDFTTHLRGSIRALSSDEPIRFEDELANIKAYLNIEKMRFGDMLVTEFDIDCVDFMIIPLAIQPLVENAVRHGVYPRVDQVGVVSVRSLETDKAYVIEVEDNGVGFDVRRVLEESRNDSVGLKSVIFRLKTLMNVDVAVNSVIGSGTKVTVTLPKEADADQ